MKEIVELSEEEFFEGWAEGYITDLIFIRNEIYGKDPRGQADKPEPYKIVKCKITVQP